jgi:hypothetical protein
MPKAAAPPETPEDQAPTVDASAKATGAIDAVIDPKLDMSFEFNGHVYTFKRKRLDATQFRLPMQKGFNEAATEWLLGPPQFALFLSRNLDEDGCTPSSVFYEFIEALGQELGTGNS